MTLPEEPSHATQRILQQSLDDQQTEINWAQDKRLSGKEQERQIKFENLSEITFQRAPADTPESRNAPPDHVKEQKAAIKWAEQLRHYEDDIRRAQLDSLKEFSENYQLRSRAVAEAPRPGMRDEWGDKAEDFLDQVGVDWRTFGRNKAEGGAARAIANPVVCGLVSSVRRSADSVVTINIVHIEHTQARSGLYFSPEVAISVSRIHNRAS